MKRALEELRAFAEVEAYPDLLGLFAAMSQSGGRGEYTPTRLLDSVREDLAVESGSTIEGLVLTCLDRGELGAARYLLGSYTHDKKIDAEFTRRSSQLKAELEMRVEACQGLLLLLENIPDPELASVRRHAEEILSDKIFAGERPGALLALLSPLYERIRTLVAAIMGRHKREFDALVRQRVLGANQDLDRALDRLQHALGAEDRLPTAQRFLDIATRARAQELTSSDIELLHSQEPGAARLVGERKSIPDSIRTAHDASAALRRQEPALGRVLERDTTGRLVDLLSALAPVGTPKLDRGDVARRLALFFGIEQPQVQKNGFCEIRFTQPRIPALRASNKVFSGKIGLAVPGAADDAAVASAVRSLGLPETALKLVYVHKRMEGSLRPIMTPDLNVVFLDIADVLLIAGCDAPSRQVAFQQVLLPRLPIQRIKPYQGGGPVEPEMFRGRQSDMARLRAPKGPTVLFSGRMMGKSSMLKKLDTEINSATSGAGGSSERAIFLSNAGSDLLPHLVRKLAEALGGVAGPKSAEIEDRLASAQGGSSQANQEKRLENLRKLVGLLLQKYSRLTVFIDEADNFAKEDGRRPRAQSLAWKLRDLEFESPERLRFIFAGFQNIHREVLYRNSAFANWFSLLKLEPLPQEEAKALVVEPFADCGFTFSSPACVERILEFTGRHPLLIHEACWRLMERAVGRRALGRGAELVEITAGDVAIVCREEQLRERLRQVLSLNLDDYPRLKLVVYLILFWSKEIQRDADLRRVGFLLDDIRALLEQFFSDRLNENFDERNLGALAYELEALGIIAKQGDRYLFANRAFGEMLLADRDFDRQLTDLLEHVTRPKEVEPRRFATVATFDFEKLVARHDGPRLLVGLPGTSRSDVARRLFVTTGSEASEPSAGNSGEMMDRPAYLISAAGCKSRASLAGSLRTALREGGKPSKGIGTLLSAHGFGTVIVDDADDLAAAGQLPELLKELRGEGVRSLIVGGAPVARAYIGSVADLDADVVPMRRLREEDLKAWAEESRGGPILVLVKDCRKRLLEVTGGYGPLLELFRKRLGQRGNSGGEVCPEIRDVEEFARLLTETEMDTQLLGTLQTKERELLSELHAFARRMNLWTLSMEWVVSEVFAPLSKRGGSRQEWFDPLDVLVMLDLVSERGTGSGREIELQEGGPVARVLDAATRS